MRVLEFFKNNDNRIFDEDGIGIRNMKEQNEYVISPEYQRILKELEELKERKEKRPIREKERMRIYNKNRYKIERKINNLTYIEGNITSNYFPIKLDRIPKITQDGKIIKSNK